MSARLPIHKELDGAGHVEAVREKQSGKFKLFDVTGLAPPKLIM